MRHYDGVLKLTLYVQLHLKVMLVMNEYVCNQNAVLLNTYAPYIHPIGLQIPCT